MDIDNLKYKMRLSLKHVDQNSGITLFLELK